MVPTNSAGSLPRYDYRPYSEYGLHPPLSYKPVTAGAAIQRCVSTGRFIRRVSWCESLYGRSVPFLMAPRKRRPSCIGRPHRRIQTHLACVRRSLRPPHRNGFDRLQPVTTRQPLSSLPFVFFVLFVDRSLSPLPSPPPGPKTAIAPEHSICYT
jgi:hypothetical protein